MLYPNTRLGRNLHLLIIQVLLIGPTSTFVMTVTSPLIGHNTFRVTSMKLLYNQFDLRQLQKGLLRNRHNRTKKKNLIEYTMKQLVNNYFSCASVQNMDSHEMRRT